MGSTVNPVAQFSGLASGIQWKDIVDQLVQVQQQQQLDPVTKAISDAGAQKSAWNQFNSLVTAFNSAANALRSINGFASSTASVSASPTTNRALAAATATSSAVPGTYGLEVLSLAAAAKVGGAAVADPTAALGLAGSFSLNGQAVTVAAGDSLQAIRDKVNALNGGTTPTNVSASILQTATGQNRLILTSTVPGASGLTVTDGGAGVAQGLGFLTTQSTRISSATMAVAAAMGVSVPPPSTIKVNGKTVSVDLSVDSLTDIANKIRAAGAEASVASEPYGAGTAYRLSVGGAVTADPADANSAATITALGFGAGDLRAAAQQVASPTAFTDGGSAASASSLLANLSLNGSALGIAAGDAINVTGKRGDGSTVTVGITVQAGDTLDTLLTRLNSTVDGFGAGTRPASATIGPDGKVRLVDGTGGDSRLAFSLQLAKADGTTTDLGTGVTEVTGRSRQLVAGSDAQVRVDGALITRSTNTISDAIPGVTLSLQQAEPGTTVTTTVSADVTARKQAVTAFANAYNSLVTFVQAQQQDGATLQYNSSLRSAQSQLLAAVRTTVSGAGTYTQLATAGVALDRYGKLQVSDAALTTTLGDTTNSVTFFDAIGSAVKTVADNLTAFGSGLVSTQLTTLDTRVSDLTARSAQISQRLDDQRALLTKQFSAMEQAISKLNAQGNWLQSQLGALTKG